MLCEGTGDSGIGSIPKCSVLRNGDGAPERPAAKSAGSSDGGYVGVFVIECLSGKKNKTSQSDCVPFEKERQRMCDAP